MSAITANFWPFAINWLVLFAACYIVVEFGQKYLYDEVTKSVGLKVTLGSLVLALVLTWTGTSYDTMFTSNIHWTLLLSIVAFAVFVLVFQFQPLHGGAIGVATILIVGGMCTLAGDSLMVRNAAVPREITTPAKALRRPVGPAITPKAATGADAVEGESGEK